MEAVLEKIKALNRARYPLVYLLTHEEDRVERGLRRLCEKEKMGFHRWRCSQGLGDGTTFVEGSQDPVSALATIAKNYSEPALFLFEDLHAHLDDPHLWRAIRDQMEHLGKRGQVIVIVAPSLNVPAELEKDLMVLDVPLPSAEEVGRLLDVLTKSQKISRDDLGPPEFEMSNPQ